MKTAEEFLVLIEHADGASTARCLIRERDREQLRAGALWALGQLKNSCIASASWNWSVDHALQEILRRIEAGEIPKEGE